jgi:hypothetical protein
MEEKKKGRRGGDRYLFRSEEEDGEEEKGSGNERRDWLTADLRQAPRLATRRSAALSTKQLAAPTAY